MENEVKVLKLVTGEEIITKMTEGEDGSLLLEGPLHIQWNSSTPNQLSLIPWIFAGNPEKVTLESKHVLIILDATAQSTENYRAAVAGIPQASSEKLGTSSGSYGQDEVDFSSGSGSTD